MDRKVFTYKDVEEAKKYIGKTGIVGDNMARVARGIGIRGVIQVRTEGDDTFSVPGQSFWHQFMSPDPEPVEKWVPFTAEDMPSLHLKAVRMKGWVAGAFRTVVGWDALNKGVDTGGLYVSPEDLFRYWEFIDGAPCGKKVTE